MANQSSPEAAPPFRFENKANAFASCCRGRFDDDFDLILQSAGRLAPTEFSPIAYNPSAIRMSVSPVSFR